MSFTNKLDEILDELRSNQVEFILVGGMAAVLHGAPIATQDLDIVHRRTPENIDRLLHVLTKIDAIFRGQPAGRKLAPTVVELGGRGHLNLKTRLGPLDILCELEGDLSYEDLLPHTTVFRDGAVELRVLDLETIIKIKSAVNRAKDRLVLPILIAALKEKDSQD